MLKSWLTFGLSMEQEDRFRQAHLGADIAMARICFWLSLVIVLVFAVNDYGFFGLSWRFYGLQTLRLVVIIHTFILIKRMRGLTNYRCYDRDEFTWGLVYAAFIISLVATRPHAYIAHTIPVVLTVFVTLLVIPNRFANQLLLSLLYTAGETLVVVPSLAISPQASVTTLLSMYTAIAFAIICGWQLHSWRRREFLAREQEQEARAEAERQLTERMRAEQALWESEERLSAAFAQGAIGMTLTALDGRFLQVNAACCAMLGYTESELQVRTFCDLTSPDDLPANHSGIQRIVNGETTSFRMEKRYIHKDGHLLWADMSTVAARDTLGNVCYYVTHMVDITDRKRAEQVLQASLREKEVLLKEIHHRVKNNMQVISSLVSLQADTLDNPALRPLFNDLRDQVRTMALVHEKLYQSASLARVDFAEYTRSLLNYLWRAHGEAAAAVRLTLEVRSVALSVETAVPCGLILNELVSNALKHAFRGRADGEVTVELHTDADGRVCLRVSDNGVGLPAGLDWRQSTSLGLQLVQMLTEQLDGTVEMRERGGTEFQLTFKPPDTEKHEEDIYA